MKYVQILEFLYEFGLITRDSCQLRLFSIVAILLSTQTFENTI